jgi:hypothetical protein
MAEHSEEHAWVAAATVRLNSRQAKRAVMRHSVWLSEERRIDVLDVYCAECRRTWDDVAGEPCVAATANEHLRGGPIGVRKKRAHHRHNCQLLGCELPDTG